MPRHLYFQLYVNAVMFCLISLISSAASAQGFLPPVTYPFSGTPSGVVVADLNLDTYCDVVIPNETSQSVTIMLANANGTLQPPQDYPIGAISRLTAIADFDLDNNPDIAVASASGIIILRGYGDGTFDILSHTISVTGLYPITVGDFNKDNMPDIATAGLFSGPMVTLLGNGDGTFQTPTSYSAFAGGKTIRDLICAHMDSDDNLDLIGCYRSTTANGLNDIILYKGNGDGTFQSPPLRSVINGGWPSNIITGSFGSGSTTETLAASLSMNLTSIDFAQTIPLRTSNVYGGNLGYDVCTADFNGDSAADIAITSLTDVVVKINDPLNPGTFQDTPFVTNAVSSIQFLDSGDINGDGNPDLVSVSLGAGTISVIVNNFPTNSRVEGWHLY